MARAMAALVLALVSGLTVERRFGNGDYPSKAAACKECQQDLCSGCFAVSVSPSNKDFTWYCSMLPGLSPFPGVHKSDAC